MTGIAPCCTIWIAHTILCSDATSKALMALRQTVTEELLNSGAVKITMENCARWAQEQINSGRLDQVQASIKELELVSDESARLVQEAKALQGQLSAAPDGVTMDWACFGKCNAREQLLCASFATIPFVGPFKAAACVALIATKCGLECQ